MEGDLLSSSNDDALFRWHASRSCQLNAGGGSNEPCTCESHHPGNIQQMIKMAVAHQDRVNPSHRQVLFDKVST